MEELEVYDFAIKYIPGVTNVGANALSRRLDYEKYPKIRKAALRI